MNAPDYLLKPKEIRREIERRQTRIEALRRFAWKLVGRTF